MNILLNSKLYIETSVWSGYYTNNNLFMKENTRKFFKRLKRNKYELFVSSVLYDEIYRSDELTIARLVKLINNYKPEILTLDYMVDNLVKEYINNNIFSKKQDMDAKHIAIATVNFIDYVVIWNYRDMVNVDTRRLVNSVNLKFGYRQPIEIVSPMEVLYSWR